MHKVEEENLPRYRLRKFKIPSEFFSNIGKQHRFQINDVYMFTQHVHTRIDIGCPLPKFYKRIRIKRKDLAISVEGLFNNILNNG